MPKILLIDDDVQVLNIITAFLESDRHVVTTATNGMRGLKLLETQQFDLVITDIIMPQQDGFAVLMSLMDMPTRPKIIAISGGSASIDLTYILHTCKTFLPDKVLPKPVDYMTLSTAIRELLEEKPSLDTSKILIIDDEELSRSILQLMLSEQYVNFLQAGNGIEGLELLALHDDVDLILLDLEMPIMNGMEMLSIMRNTPKLKNIPVVIAAGDRAAAIRLLSCGADDFVTKPYEPRELIVRIKNLIKVRKSQLRLRSFSDELERKNIELKAALSLAEQVSNSKNEL